MADLSDLAGGLSDIDAGGCPAPFIGESLYPYKGGFLEGRNCAPNPLQISANASRCCIPCPVFDYVYSNDFHRLANGSAWVHVVGFTLCVFLLLSMAVLSTKYTKRAYLNIMLLVGICFVSLGFIVPLGVDPPQCFDAVTPNDMYSNMTCAWSGGFITFGGLLLVTWILARALFMHLQICWNFAPGKLSYATASILAFSVTIGLTAAVLAKAGVSFRFGGFCHINVGSISTYWGWLLGFAAVAFVLQVLTFGYCIKVYLTAAFLGRQELPSTTGSSVAGNTRTPGNSRKTQARTALRRVQQVLVLQWRSLTIVAIAIFTFAFVCVVFIVLDNKYTVKAFENTEALIPWILCLISNKDPNKCLQYTGPIIIPEPIAVATLFVLGCVGVEAFFLLCRPEVFVGWWHLAKSLFKRKAKTRPLNDSDFVIVHHPYGVPTDARQPTQEFTEKEIA